MVKTTQEIELLEAQLNEMERSEAVKIAEGLIADENHNGWVNRETWSTVLHLQNDPLLYEASLAVARNAYGQRGVAADEFEKWVKTNIEGVLFDRDKNPVEVWVNLTKDVGSLWRVDWFAVADTFLVEVAEENE